MLITALAEHRVTHVLPMPPPLSHILGWRDNLITRGPGTPSPRVIGRGIMRSRDM